MRDKLQYISQDTPSASHLESIHAACNAGCKWIQLRLKNKAIREVETIARAAKAICKKHNATFIINDYVSVAKNIQPDGIHLGKGDLSPLEAREILGSNMIIGGTANTFEDILQYHKEAAVDYIGLGPFRFTATKKKLSPILGLEGYQKIIRQCKINNIRIPIVAIGGIRIGDIDALMQTGVTGIAISSLITNSDDKTTLIQLINSIQQVYETTNYSQ